MKRHGNFYMIVLMPLLVITIAVTIYGAYITSHASSVKGITEITANSEQMAVNDTENTQAADYSYTDDIVDNSDSSDVMYTDAAAGITDNADIAYTDAAADNSDSADIVYNVASADNSDNENITYTVDGSGSADTAEDEDSEFSDKDLMQEADLSNAVYLNMVSGEDTYISSKGTYVISGDVTEASVIIDAPEAKVWLVLDNVTITNTDFPAICIYEADKVFLTTIEGSENSLTVSGSFITDDKAAYDGVIFSKDDLVLNGLGTLSISSSANGVVCKDDLKITGGTYNVTSVLDSFEANNSIRIYDGNFTIDSSKDGFNCGDDETMEGLVHILGGSITIDALRQGIQATSEVMIDGGNISISSAEGIESTYIVINDGNIDINASDDGINATALCYNNDVCIEINGGYITIVMGSGDTDALDANGSMVINGGNLDITAQSSFDYDVSGVLNGGTVIVNGQQVTELTASMGGMGGRGGHGFH